MTKQELITYCLTFPAVYKDNPFDGEKGHSDDGTWTMIRHRGNKKGFAHIYERHERLRINLKYDPNEALFWRQIYEDVTPGWHMNKEHWNTVTLNGDVPEQELERMIEHSFDLTKPKTKKKELSEPYRM
ncbi:MAG: MmcQ/YjbR family DNA-binding protein [Lachnospiraceae bacterium]|jgi:predicted DNA-binding protein (MmcQ/YjbR family)|nr:MmcQ/YjbR family DNA-binding protein [Lachnospiraceae bacterium]